MQFDSVVLRVFDVRARPGKAGILKRKLADTSVSVVQGEPGNLGYFFGATVSTDENDLVFISVWQDLESIQQRFGKDWERSFLPEGYEELIETCSVRHLRCDGEVARQPA